MEFAYVNYVFNTEKRRKRNDKLKRKRGNTLLKAGANDNTKSKLSFIAPSLEIIYQNSMSSFGDTSRQSSIDSGCSSTGVGRRSFSTPLVSEPNQLLNKIRTEKEEHVFSQSRRASVARSRTNTVLIADPNCFKLTPQELANGIDRMSRVLFPITFLLFNLMYWIILQARAFE